MAAHKPLTADTSIADWLADPVGNAILTDMLAQGGLPPRSSSPCAASRSSALSR